METIVLAVGGMDCSGCEQRIHRVVGRLEGVRGLTADHERGQVQVVLDPSALAAVCAAIEQAGYTVARDGDDDGEAIS
jgi:copper chaperone